jgi:uncharacterized UBP type Zn finger protein
MTMICSHLDRVAVTDLPAEIPGCEECLRIGSWWVHLRMCETCGRIGCCDSSPKRHATAHFRATGHPIVRSAEPGEEWSWCYLDEILRPPAARGRVNPDRNETEEET